MTLRDHISRTIMRADNGWLLRNAAGLSGIQIFNLAAGLATTVLLARILGAESYGVYTFVLGWIFIVGMPLQMGLPTLLMRQVAVYRGTGDNQKLQGIVRWSFRLIGLGAVIVLLGCGGFSAYLIAIGQWPAAATPMLVGSSFALLFLLAILALFRSIISGFENVVAANVPDTLLRPGLFLLAIAVTLPQAGLGTGPGIVMALHAFAALMATVLAWSMAAKLMRHISDVGSRSVVYESRAWLSSLWPMTVISGAAIINNRLDIAMLGMITGPVSVAVYDVGAKVAGLMMVTQALLNAAIAPRVARLYSGGDREQVQALMVQACRWSFIPSAMLLGVIWVGGPTLLPALFGTDYADAYLVAGIVAAGFLFSTGVGAVGLLLNMSGHERVTAKVVTMSAVINAGLNIFLIPVYGAYGAASATAVTVLCVQTFLWRKARSLTGIRGDLLAPHRSDKTIAPEV